jgi:hypothetical protein
MAAGIRHRAGFKPAVENFGRFLAFGKGGLYCKATRAHLRHTRVALATKPCSQELQTKTARKSLPQGVTIPNEKKKSYVTSSIQKSVTCQIK